ncbi:unnamed protein product [Ectocarpus sp. 4 AP-2014]
MCTFDLLANTLHIHASTCWRCKCRLSADKKCIRVERITNTEEPYELPLSLRLRPAPSSISIGGHLAAQAVANLAAAAFFTTVLKISFVSYIPTALRLGAGCGISMLVGVLGMRNVGLLVANSFTLQPVTWQMVIGLAIITAAFAKVSNSDNTMRKWMWIVGLPMVSTVLVYAVVDRSKFQGYSLAEKGPLSNWRSGSVGTLDFSAFGNAPQKHWFYVIRMFFSIVINISSILLVLIDAVCLNDVRSKVKSTVEIDFSNAIGGTKKVIQSFATHNVYFRHSFKISMYCAIERGEKDYRTTADVATLKCWTSHACTNFEDMA